MKIKQFHRLLGSHRGHRCCFFDDKGNCTRKDECGQCWWAITIRGGKTFVGASPWRDADTAEIFTLATYPPDDREYMTSILIEEIVAIEEISPPPLLQQQQSDAPTIDLASLRKDVGRLYGIIKDMERERAA